MSTASNVTPLPDDQLAKINELLRRTKARDGGGLSGLYIKAVVDGIELTRDLMLGADIDLLVQPE